jgi:hypothetical protein
MLMSVNHRHVQTFCAQSLRSICQQYRVPYEHPTVQCIDAVINSNPLSHTDALALFFMLLNIDTQLKESMLLSESAMQQRKLGNFYMNMRKHIVPSFIAADECESAVFVTGCVDAWEVA